MTTSKYKDFESFYKAWLSASGVKYSSVVICNKRMILHAPFLEWNHPFIQTKMWISKYEMGESYHNKA
jgi:hypothetical protein